VAKIKIGGYGDFENFMGPVMSVAWSYFCLDGSDVLSQRAASILQDHGVCCNVEPNDILQFWEKFVTSAK
jgi:hypothetical protein